MALKSWLASANDPGSDFPIQNLPYGVFRSGSGNAHRRRHRRPDSRSACLRDSTACSTDCLRRSSRPACRAPAQSTHGARARIVVALASTISPRSSMPSRPAAETQDRVEAAPGSHARCCDAASRPDRRLHRLLRLHPSRHASRQAVPSRQSRCCPITSTFPSAITAALLPSCPADRRFAGPAARSSRRNPNPSSAPRNLSTTNWRWASSSVPAISSGNPSPSAEAGEQQFLVSAWSTTGPRATSNPGSISRSALSSPRALPPRFLPGSFPSKRWLPTAFRPARVLRATPRRSPISNHLIHPAVHSTSPSKPIFSPRACAKPASRLTSSSRSNLRDLYWTLHNSSPTTPATAAIFVPATCSPQEPSPVPNPVRRAACSSCAPTPSRSACPPVNFAGTLKMAIR